MKHVNHNRNHKRTPFTSRHLVAALLAVAVAAFALPTVATAAPSGKVNVNTASAAQLELLPRVGPSIAQRILDYREANGGFDATEDLMLVRGIGEKTYDGMADYVAVEGETTLSEKVPTARKSADDESSDD